MIVNKLLVLGGVRISSALTLGVIMAALWAAPPQVRAEDGVTDSIIRIGAVTALEGDGRSIGVPYKNGIEAALRGEEIQGRRIEYVVINDFYDPNYTVEATQELVSEGIFAMLGNMGSPTAQVSLPILAEHKVPAVGFYTGASFLRPGEGDIINYRPGYADETASLVKTALGAGIKPSEICVYAQNDAYGMSGLEGVRRALAQQSDAKEIVAALDKILQMEGENPPRNFVGPVGVYTRDTLAARDGYESLKSWEAVTGTPCRLVVTVAIAAPAARFAGYVRSKKERWLLGAPSPVTGTGFVRDLKQFGVSDRVIITQVVPPPESTLPIISEARKALGEELGYISLEGFIVGKMFLAIMRDIQGDLTRQNFMDSVQGQVYDLGGLELDFIDDNQGSDFVWFTYFNGDDFAFVHGLQLNQLFQE